MRPLPSEPVTMTATTTNPARMHQRESARRPTGAQRPTTIPTARGSSRNRAMSRTIAPMGISKSGGTYGDQDDADGDAGRDGEGVIDQDGDERGEQELAGGADQQKTRPPV